jgi:predicted transcriptional regulator
MKVLTVQVGARAEDALAQAAATMKALATGDAVAPHYAVGFASLVQMLVVFTPKRLELLTVLRGQGPLSVAALARALGRDYKNVHCLHGWPWNATTAVA